MLKIRLQRVGRKHEPAFRLVLTNTQNSTKSGKFKEVLGSYDPRKDSDVIDGERVKYWLSQGAKPTDTVHNLLLKHGIIEGKKINVLPKKTVPATPEARPLESFAPKSEEKNDEDPKGEEPSAEEKTALAPEEPEAPTENVEAEPEAANQTL